MFKYSTAVTRWQNAAHVFLHSDSYSVFSVIHWKQLPAHWSFDFLPATLLREALLISLLLFCFSGFKTSVCLSLDSTYIILSELLQGFRKTSAQDYYRAPLKKNKRKLIKKKVLDLKKGVLTC